MQDLEERWQAKACAEDDWCEKRLKFYISNFYSLMDRLLTHRTNPTLADVKSTIQNEAADKIISTATNYKQMPKQSSHTFARPELVQLCSFPFWKERPIPQLKPSHPWFVTKIILRNVDGVLVYVGQQFSFLMNELNSWPTGQPIRQWFEVQPIGDLLANGSTRLPTPYNWRVGYNRSGIGSIARESLAGTRVQ